jgi:hypothetical protein
MIKDGRFKKGSVPWNKGMEGFNPSPQTQFKQGEKFGEIHPSWKGGIQVMKADCVYEWEGNGKRVRRPRKIYENHYGEIPKGHIIIHVDGDRYNDDISNLEAISRAENLKRNLKRETNGK